MQEHFMRLKPTMMEATGCTYIYDLRQCHSDPEEENYEVYVMYNTTRAAIHVGNREEEIGLCKDVQIMISD